MPKRRKIFYALVSLAGIFLCLVVILLVATPRLINLEAVKKEIKKQYTSATGGEIEYRHIRLGFFPRPHIVISEVAIKYTENVDGTIDSLRVYPKILPLLTGDLQIGSIYSRSPEFNIRLPSIPTDKSQPSKPFPFETLPDRLHALLASLAESKIPSVVTRVRNGGVQFIRGNDRFLRLQAINGQIKSQNDTMEFAAECQSNYWQNISIEGRYKADGFKIESRIKLNQFRPHAVFDYFFSQSDLKMTNAQVNLILNLNVDGPEQLIASVQGSIPFVYLHRGNTELKFTDTRFDCGLQLNDHTTTLTLLKLDLNNPPLSLAGRLNIDPLQSGIQLELEGRQIDVANTAKLALALTKNDQTVSEIFEILRSGDFQQVTLKTQGSNWAQLADENRLVIQGRLVGGEIFIPDVQLKLKDVQGDGMIANGVLQGENIEARMGNSSGKQGKISIPLTEATAPFHIEGLIQADLSQLPAILTRLIENDPLKKELSLLNKIEGHAIGMLVIGEDTRDINVKVMASDIRINADYQRISYPVIVNGGSFLLDGSRIELRNLNASVGQSSFSQLTSRFGWEKSPSLKLSAKSAKIDLAQTHAWLMQNKDFEKNLKDLRSVNGTLTLQNANLSGPLFEPDRWRLLSSGSIQNLSVGTPLLPADLTVNQGHLIFEGDRLKVVNWNAKVGKSLVAGLTANIKWGKTTTLTANAGQTVISLDEIYLWLQSQDAFKKYVKYIQPLNGTLAFGDLAFEGSFGAAGGGKLSLNGTVEKWHVLSAKYPTDIELTGGDLSWRGNRIDLHETSLRFGTSTISRLSLGKQWGTIPLLEFSADSADVQIADLYPWLVSFQTLNNAFKGFAATRGKLTLSELNFKGPGGSPGAWRFHVAGNLQDLALESDYFKAPIHISTAKFSAADTHDEAGLDARIQLDAAQLKWEDSLMMLAGNASLSADQVWLDLMLNADRISWGQVDQVVELDKRLKPVSSGKSIELAGSLKIESDRFVYDRYIWQPINADISFGKTDTRIVINRADLCEIQFPGTINISDDAFEISFKPVAKDQALAPSIACLSDKQNLADGQFNLEGELTSKGSSAGFPKSLTGELRFTSEQGRIYRFGMLAKIFALLNVTEIYRGEVPDLKGKGFAYNTMVAKGVFKGGKLIIKDTSIDSPSMGIAIEGDIDLIKEKVNLVVLVAPFKTIDRIVKLIPLIGNIMGGNLISIPFRAIGDLGDPDVIPLSPTAVGSGLLGILERTLKLPITIIQPVLPGSKDKNAKEKETNGSR